MKKNRNLSKKPNYYDLGKIRKDFSLKKRKCIIVEGEENSNDSRVYSKIILKDVLLIPGRNKEQIINDFKTYFPNQIAIIDKDYDNSIPDIKNVFLTDYNDIECTAINIVSDPTFLKKCIKINNSVTDQEFETKIYSKAIELSEKLSGINKLIYNKYLWNNEKHSYLINMFIDKNNNKTNIFYIKQLKEIINNDLTLNYDNITRKYNYAIDNQEIRNTKDEKQCFRGHDFFSVLAYLIDFKKIKMDILDEYNYYTDPSVYLEQKYMDAFSNNKRIKETAFYNKIKNEFPNFFE